MMDPLATMTQDRWQRLSPSEQARLRDDTGLSPQLTGLEGYRVEATDMRGTTRRFIVARSTGWRPCHIEKKTRRSHGGWAADKLYASVTKLGLAYPGPNGRG